MSCPLRGIPQGHSASEEEAERGVFQAPEHECKAATMTSEPLRAERAKQSRLLAFALRRLKNIVLSSPLGIALPPFTLLALL